MITFLSLMAILGGLLARSVLVQLGRWSLQTWRDTDFLVLVPFWGGVGGLLYVLWTLAARFLP